MDNLCLYYDHKLGYLDNQSQSHSLLLPLYTDLSWYSNSNLLGHRKMVVGVQLQDQRNSQNYLEHLMDNVYL